MIGSMGKILFIDLGTASIEERPMNETIAGNFLGGLGLGAKILYDEMQPNTGPFSPESMIGFVSGALNATGSLMAGRYTVVSKSPVTGGWNDSSSGGYFGPVLKSSGYDALFVKGISRKPVYIFIDDGKAEIRDASALWGKPVKEVERIIKAEVGGGNVCIAQTGIAGERRSLMAAIMNDGHRAAGRGGSGAVMGSKNLKAVVVRGTKKPAVADRQAQIAANRKITDWQKNGPLSGLVEGFASHGTGMFYESSVLAGDASVKNWAGAALMDLSEEEIGRPSAQESFKREKYSCNACSVGCGAIYDIKAPEGETIEDAGRPEYETMGAFGSQMLHSDPVSICICNELCNEYGLDTISTGATVAWAMECYENSTLVSDELDGIALSWGSSEAIVAITEKICKAEGIGAVLQHGSRYAANHFGKGHEALVLASGIELPQHDPRWAPGLSRTYRYDPTPGRHVKGGLRPAHGRLPPEEKYSFENTAEGDLDGVISMEIANSAGFCMFSEFALPPGAIGELVHAVTGLFGSEDERRKLGMRIFTIRHAFNLREGFRRADWTLSDRALGIPPLTDGPLSGVTIDEKKLSDAFFERIGFDFDGVPLRQTLVDIGGLDDVIRDLGL